MTSTSIKSSPRHEHVYAIVRWDTTASEDVPIDLRITVKEIVTDPHLADAEVKRLNDLNGPKDAYYFSQITRIRRGIAVELEISQPQLQIPPRHEGGGVDK